MKLDQKLPIGVGISLMCLRCHQVDPHVSSKTLNECAQHKAEEGRAVHHSRGDAEELPELCIVDGGMLEAIGCGADDSVGRGGESDHRGHAKTGRRAKEVDSKPTRRIGWGSESSLQEVWGRRAGGSGRSARCSLDFDFRGS